MRKLAIRDVQYHHFCKKNLCVRVVQYVIIVKRCACVYVNCGMRMEVLWANVQFFYFILCETAGWTVPKTNFPTGTIKYILSYLILSYLILHKTLNKIMGHTHTQFLLCMNGTPYSNVHATGASFNFLE